MLAIGTTTAVAAYKQLIEQYGVTQEAIAKMVGKSRSVIANSVRLLNLPEEVQDMLKNDEISVGHAKALAAIEDEETMIEVARKAAEGLLTVRAIERLAAELAKGEDVPEAKSDADRRIINYYTEMEISLHERLGRKVKINAGKNGKGSLVIDFFDKEDLNSIADLLANSN